MKLKQAFMSILVLSTFTMTASLAQAAAPQDQSYKEIAEHRVDTFVREAYDPYYTINSTQLAVSDFSIEDNVLTARVDIHINKTLKAKTVDELPYVKGLKKKSASLAANHLLSKAVTDHTLKAKVKDFEEYIGVAQDQNDSFRITAKLNDGTPDLENASLEYLDYLDWVPASAFIPAPAAEMMTNGENDMAKLAASAVSPASALSASAAVTYDRLAARDYANKWTSENPPGGQDATKYNPNYIYYSNDCANYVSQALLAGGIPTDSTWKPQATAWINTGLNISNGLMDYMVGTKGYFKKVAKSGVAAGGIIYALQYSHVMMVVANDGVTMLYSAHTTDRLKSSFAGFSSSEYEFYIFNTL